MAQRDVAIVGGGVIGLSCALELQALGMRVTVLERGSAARQASWAAAGMLAAHDHANPAALQPLADLSLALYPAYLARIASLSGVAVPFETEWTMEPATGRADELPGSLPGFARVWEWSLDPRKLSAALVLAVRAAGIELREHATDACEAGLVIECGGAWGGYGAKPAKGQMVRVLAPGALAVAGLGNVVVRRPDVYLVPRMDGTVVIGATVEDAGFDTTTHDADVAGLRRLAASLVPALEQAPEVERWAGLRPDHLPLIGWAGVDRLVATGHFRNGILLAPATARVVAQMVLGHQPEVGLAAFAPGRFDSSAKI